MSAALHLSWGSTVNTYDLHFRAPVLLRTFPVGRWAQQAQLLTTPIQTPSAWPTNRRHLTTLLFDGDAAHPPHEGVSYKKVGQEGSEVRDVKDWRQRQFIFAFEALVSRRQIQKYLWAALRRAELPVTACVMFRQ